MNGKYRIISVVFYILEYVCGKILEIKKIKFK